MAAPHVQLGVRAASNGEGVLPASGEVSRVHHLLTCSVFQCVAVWLYSLHEDTPTHTHCVVNIVYFLDYMCSCLHTLKTLPCCVVNCILCIFKTFRSS